MPGIGGQFGSANSSIRSPNARSSSPSMMSPMVRRSPGKFRTRRRSTSEVARNSSSPGGSAMSVLAPHRALVPAPQDQVRDQRQRHEDEDAGQGYQQECGKHSRYLQPVAGLQDPVGQPGVGAAGAGDELGDHRPDERQPAGD